MVSVGLGVERESLSGLGITLFSTCESSAWESFACGIFGYSDIRIKGSSAEVWRAFCQRRGPLPAFQMIFVTVLTTERAAQLHVDGLFFTHVIAYRAYSLEDQPGHVLLFVQSTRAAVVLRSAFMLPRLRCSSYDEMVNLLVDRPGNLGQCVFSGGFFQRAVRMPRRNLLAELEAVAPLPIPPVPEVIDLTQDSVVSVVPETELRCSESRVE